MASCQQGCGSSSRCVDPIVANNRSSGSSNSVSTGTTITEHNVQIRFPFTPYPAQSQMMSKMIQAFENRQNAILESPTGSGKSLAILCAALAWSEHKKKGSGNSTAERPMQNTSNTSPGPSMPSRNDNLEWMGPDKDIFNELIANGKLKQAKLFYASKKHERTESDMMSSEREGGGEGFSVVPKIYVASRTHKQIAQLVAELKGNTVYRPTMSVLGSRKQYCIHDDIKDLDDVNDKCKDLVSKKGCTEFQNVKTLEKDPRILPGGSHEIWDIEDLVKLGNELTACPYYGSREIAETSELVFCPYNYLIDPIIRNTMKIDLHNSIVIIDEAHNIEATSRDAATFETTTSSIVLIREELQQCINYRTLVPANSTLLEFLTIIQRWMTETNFTFNDGERDGKGVTCFTGYAMLKELEKIGINRSSIFSKYKPAFKLVLDRFESIKSDAKNQTAELVQEQNPDGTTITRVKATNTLTINGKSIKILKKMFLVLSFIFDSSQKYGNDYTLALMRKKYPNRQNRQNEKEIDFCLWCMNPGIVFSEISKITHSIVLTSGTLSPMETFSAELQTDFPIQLIANHVIDKSQVWASVIAKGATDFSTNGTYQNAQKPEYQHEIINALYNIVLNVPYGILIFFPSYSALNTMHQFMQNNDNMLEKVKERKKVFLEPQNKPAEAFKIMLDEYYQCIKGATENPVEGGIDGAVFFAVYRGKVSEGIDFNNNNCRAVVCIGIPFPYWGDKLIQLKRQYNDIQKSKARTGAEKDKLLAGSQWYDFQGYRALNQALGRCIRHTKDWGAVILLESRFIENRYIQQLSKWIIPYLMQRTGSFSNVMKDLHGFSAGHTSMHSPHTILPPIIDHCVTPSIASDEAAAIKAEEKTFNIDDVVKASKDDLITAVVSTLDRSNSVATQCIERSQSAAKVTTAGAGTSTAQSSATVPNQQPIRNDTPAAASSIRHQPPLPTVNGTASNPPPFSMPQNKGFDEVIEINSDSDDDDYRPPIAASPTNAISQHSAIYNQLIDALKKNIITTTSASSPTVPAASSLTTVNAATVSKTTEEWKTKAIELIKAMPDSLATADSLAAALSMISNIKSPQASAPATPPFVTTAKGKERATSAAVGQSTVFQQQQRAPPQLMPTKSIPPQLAPPQLTPPQLPLSQQFLPHPPPSQQQQQPFQLPPQQQPMSQPPPNGKAPLMAVPQPGPYFQPAFPQGYAPLSNGQMTQEMMISQQKVINQFTQQGGVPFSGQPFITYGPDGQPFVVYDPNGPRPAIAFDANMKPYIVPTPAARPTQQAIQLAAAQPSTSTARPALPAPVPKKKTKAQLKREADELARIAHAKRIAEAQKQAKVEAKRRADANTRILAEANARRLAESRKQQAEAAAAQRQAAMYSSQYSRIQEMADLLGNGSASSSARPSAPHGTIPSPLPSPSASTTRYNHGLLEEQKALIDAERLKVAHLSLKEQTEAIRRVLKEHKRRTNGAVASSPTLPVVTAASQVGNKRKAPASVPAPAPAPTLATSSVQTNKGKAPATATADVTAAPRTSIVPPPAASNMASALASPRYKSNLSLAGQRFQVNFEPSIKTEPRIKSEPGSSSNNNNSSTNRGNDTFIEYIETSNGLILPKRRKPDPNKK